MSLFFVDLHQKYKDLVICEIKWKDQGRNRARLGDGEVFQAEPVLIDQLDEYRYLNSEQIMQQATTSTIERFTLMTSGFEIESLLPTMRYEDDIQSAESNLSIDMNELINFINQFSGSSFDFKCLGPCD
ncbi:unnamed protein product [Camellia sinensis]